MMAFQADVCLAEAMQNDLLPNMGERQENDCLVWVEKPHHRQTQFATNVQCHLASPTARTSCLCLSGLRGAQHHLGRRNFSSAMRRMKDHPAVVVWWFVTPEIWPLRYQKWPFFSKESPFQPNHHFLGIHVSFRGGVPFLLAMFDLCFKISTNLSRCLWFVDFLVWDSATAIFHLKSRGKRQRHWEPWAMFFGYSKLSSSNGISKTSFRLRFLLLEILLRRLTPNHWRQVFCRQKAFFVSNIFPLWWRKNEKSWGHQGGY